MTLFPDGWGALEVGGSVLYLVGGEHQVMSAGLTGERSPF
jgi:hypothetical protein